MNSANSPNLKLSEVEGLNDCSNICASSLSSCTRKSPFYRYANAALYLQIARNTRVDEETGNLIPVMENIELKALLKQSSDRDVKERLMQGLDQNETYMEGWLVDPMEFPAGISTPIECNADVEGRRGRLRIPLLVSNPYRVEKVTGRKLRAFFKVVG